MSMQRSSYTIIVGAPAASAAAAAATDDDDVLRPNQLVQTRLIVACQLRFDRHVAFTCPYSQVRRARRTVYRDLFPLTTSVVDALVQLPATRPHDDVRQSVDEEIDKKGVKRARRVSGQ